MAGAQCAYLTFSLPLKKKPLLLSLSSIPANSKLNSTRRTNHLRKKLLKTLTKPYPNLIIPVDPPPNRIIPVEPERLEKQEVAISLENVGIEGVSNVIKGEFGKYWVFKFGLYLVGVFVFQIICAVWVFRSEEIVQEEGKGSVFEGKSREKSSLLLSGNGGLGVSDLEERVGVIQAMAREVRESERLKSKADEEDNGGVVRTGIEKELDRRLVNLQKKLQSSAKNMPVVPIKEKDDLVGKDKIELLTIKKKFKFRGPPGSMSDKPNGFSGTKETRVSESNTSLQAIEDEINVFDSLDLLSGDSSVGITPPFGKDMERKQLKERSNRIQTPGKKLGKERMQKKPKKETGKAEPASRMGATQEASLERPVGSNKSTSRVKDEQLKHKVDEWWWSLPYVVAVLMGRGHDGEGPRGLFTLKTNPCANDVGDLSHIVAFEDRGDATNFCYILKSFFEDLGDFSADIVPLSTKELEDEVKSNFKKVVVVKKGQLKLYAGQPLTDVEMALRSLVE